MTKQTKTVSPPITDEDRQGDMPKVVDTAPAAPVDSPADRVQMVKQPAAVLNEDGDPPEADETPASTQADLVPIPGLAQDDWNGMRATLATGKKLGDEQYQKLQNVGYSKAFVDQYIANQAASVLYTEKVTFDQVGGRKGWEDKYVPWAQKNLTPETLVELDKLLTSPDSTQWAGAIAQVRKAYEDSVGVAATKTVEGTRPGSNAAGSKPFAGPNGYMAAIGDKRWLVDEDYTAKVRARARASRAAGIALT